MDGAEAGGRVCALGDVVIVVFEIIASDIRVPYISLDTADGFDGLVSVGSRSWDVFWP